MREESKNNMVLTVGIDKFEVSNEEADNIKKLLTQNKTGMVELRNGEMVNLPSISSIKHKPIW